MAPSGRHTPAARHCTLTLQAIHEKPTCPRHRPARASCPCYRTAPADRRAAVDFTVKRRRILPPVARGGGAKGVGKEGRREEAEFRSEFSLGLAALVGPDSQEHGHGVEGMVREALRPAVGGFDAEGAKLTMLKRSICEFGREAAASQGCGGLRLNIEVVVLEAFSLRGKKGGKRRRRAPEQAPASKMAEKMGDLCPVCLDEFAFDGDEKVTVVDCSHAFHQQCIERWAEKHRSCPLCRAEVRR